MPTAKRKAGRPRKGPELVSITMAVARHDLEMAEELAVALDRRALGIQHGRMDVLRAALSRGLTAMRAEIDAQQ